MDHSKYLPEIDPLGTPRSEAPFATWQFGKGTAWIRRTLSSLKAALLVCQIDQIPISDCLLSIH